MSRLQETILGKYISSWYWADTTWTAKTVSVAGDRLIIQSPNQMQIDVGGVSLTQYSQQALDISIAANWDDYANNAIWDGLNYSTAANRAGQDIYVYAVAPTTGSVPLFLLSGNATYPIGYTASNSRKVAGFHCLCLDVGTITGHTLSGYLTGDILPSTVWCLKHKSGAFNGNVGQFYDSSAQNWWGIYPLSGTNTAPTNIYGGTILNNITWNDAVDAAAILGMTLPRDAGFQHAAAGSNEGTVITGSAQPSPFTAIGYVDTAGRRMISNLGMESGCGLITQWLDEQSYQYDGGNHTHDVTVPGTAGTFTSTSVDPAPPWNWQDLGKGQLYKQGLAGDVKFLAGGSWDLGGYCGSRCRYSGFYRWGVDQHVGVRLVARSVER